MVKAHRRLKRTICAASHSGFSTKAGVETSATYDFKGNLLSGSRQLAQTVDAALAYARGIPGSTKKDDAAGTIFVAYVAGRTQPQISRDAPDIGNVSNVHASLRGYFFYGFEWTILVRGGDLGAVPTDEDSHLVSLAGKR
jgi:hypothetical protein